MACPFLLQGPPYSESLMREYTYTTKKLLQVYLYLDNIYVTGVYLCT
jgi:hypothetical protein